MTRNEAIAALMAAEGYTNHTEFLELCVGDSVCPAICMACGKRQVQSALVLEELV